MFELLFQDILFDVEYTCYVKEDYQTLALYSNNTFISNFDHISDIAFYFKTTYSYLKKYNEFDLEKSEYVWSIKKFMNRNVSKDYHIKKLMYKQMKEIVYMYCCLTDTYKEIGNYSFVDNSRTKLYMILETKKELSRKYHSATKGRFVHFDDVLLWNIELKLTKLFKKLEEYEYYEPLFFDNITIRKTK